MRELQKLEKTVFSSESVFEEEYEAYMEAEKNKKKEVEMVITNDSEDEIGTDEEMEDSDEESEVDKSELFESEEE